MSGFSRTVCLDRSIGEWASGRTRHAIRGVASELGHDEKGSPFYDRPDVAGFSQFAVRPSHQNRGIGSTLLRLVEGRARALGVVELALNTSERATLLINLYLSKGYRFIEHVQWSETNYGSVILAKRLR